MGHDEGLYIVFLSIHGLIRSRRLELGRDADTGGQTKYVVELARALGEMPEVAQVDLLTRLVKDSEVDDDYGREVELLSDSARIIRIKAGPSGYIPKESLWDHLDNFADNAKEWMNRQPRMPDVLHSHYADAAYVAVRLSNMTEIPLVHTAHSLGRDKRRRLLAIGLSGDEIEQKYNMKRRIDAEEETLANSDIVITSTKNEIKDQYEIYDFYNPSRMRVIPPGIDLESFHPPILRDESPDIKVSISRFLDDPEKPMILAISRPDKRKNLNTLMEVYGRSDRLQAMANLVVIAGNRDQIRDMDEGAKEVLTDLLILNDDYDLYGKAAIPKHHASEEIPALYRMAASSGGVFANPALTEPFGLTLLEAAACGLPIVATENGGPVDIVNTCRNGLLIDPLDHESLSRALEKILSDKSYWLQCSKNGLQNIQKHYSWQAHAERYLEIVKPLIGKRKIPTFTPETERSPVDRNSAIFSDIDQNLIGDQQSLQQLIEVINTHRSTTSFGIATGRRLDSALKAFKEHDIPVPDILITSLGTEIYFSSHLTPSKSWQNHIDHLWNRRELERLLDDLPGLVLQSEDNQSKFKLSYHYDPKAPDALSVEDIISLLRKEEQAVNVIFSYGQYLDIIPIRASKGLALRYVANLWTIPLENILAAGGSGADEDIMRGNTKAVVVANRHDEELSNLTDIDDIYFAKKPFAAGILDAIDHYNFFSSVTS